MDREEPTVGQPDLSDIKFRASVMREKPNYQPEMPREHNYNLWWQIALGVFLGMLVHSIVVGAYNRREANQALQALTIEPKKAEKQAMKELEAMTREMPRVVERPAYRASPPTPLLDRERCMQGRRFKRVENGWEQLPFEPC